MEAVFSDPNENIWAELAAESAKILSKKQYPYDEIMNAWWCALAMLYEILARRKQIPALSDLPKEKKTFYWNIAMKRDTNKIHRIWICQACYVFDIITEKQ